MDELWKILTSVQGQSFAVPAISVAVGIILRISSRNDKYARTRTMEDFAVGFDLFLAAVTYLVIKAIDFARQLTGAKTVDEQQTLLSLVILAVILLAIFSMTLQVIILVVRKRGWDSKGRMTKTGLWTPIIYGLVSLWLAVILVTH